MFIDFTVSLKIYIFSGKMRKLKMFVSKTNIIDYIKRSKIYIKIKKRNFFR